MYNYHYFFLFTLEADSVFVHLSSMLGLVASKLNVIVSPLRATILQVHVCEDLSSGWGFNLTAIFKRTKQAMIGVFRK